MVKIYTHPFREGVKELLRKHLAEKIVDRFDFIFETELYDKWEDKFIWAQEKQDQLILQVFYREITDKDENLEFICDVYSWESKSQTEKRLLRAITDKYKAGQIGLDWIESGSMINVSGEISSGKHETPDE